MKINTGDIILCSGNGKLSQRIKWFKKSICWHTFDMADLKSRDVDGNVSWACSKCGKIYIAHCGLDILSHGKPIQDKWDKETV